MSTAYHCLNEPCTWTGRNPDWTDAGVIMEHPVTGVLFNTREHLPVCPRCKYIIHMTSNPIKEVRRD